MQQQQGFEPPTRSALGMSNKWGVDPSDMKDIELREWLLKGVQWCSMVAMELIVMKMHFTDTSHMSILCGNDTTKDHQIFHQI